MIALRNVDFSLGATLILSKADFSMNKGERLALIGRNGAGKSTLMKLLNGQFSPASGAIEFQKGVKTAYLPQEVPTDTRCAVEDIILEGLGEKVQVLLDYHQQTRTVAEAPTDTALEKLQRLQERVESQSGWEWQSEVEKWCSLLEIEPQADFSTLSGGLKRRVLLGKALIAKPDLLMLDEPTNHLDIPSIQWLETFLLTQNISLLFVTHDKAFLNKVATTIVELDRGRLLRFPVPYNAYLEEKERQLEVEATERARFDKKLAEEEVWIRKGLQARRTRNMGRVRNLMQMREDHQARMHRKGNVSLNAQSTGKSGAKVFTLKNVSYQWSDQPLIKDLSLLIGRGDKVGIVGTNGCGKSTLIKLILGQLSPNQGSVEVGTRIELGYFDQLRDQLDEQKTPREVVFDGYEYADVHGKRQHVVGYLEKFLFDKNRSQTPIKVLSGGERNRLLLARMLAKPANVLILDEPTNDLDLETLEILEDVLVDFEGTVLLVSHDREFMSNVCTNILVFQGQGVVKEYVAGLDNWEQLLPKGAKKSEAKVKEKASQEPQEKPKTTVQKLSYKERKELSALPDKIEEFEDKIAQVQQQLSDPEVYKQSDGQKIKELGDQVSALQSELDTMMHRWEELLARDEAS